MTSTTLTGLLRACHPAPCAAVTAFTSALALAAGRGAGTALVAAAVLSGHLSVGWSNDWLDAGRDRAAARPDKPIVGGTVTEAQVRAGALASLVLCVPLSVLAAGLWGAAVHLLAVGVAWTYNLWLKGTTWSPVPYAAAFGLLPVFVAASVGGSAPWWTVAATALLGAGAHFTNALPDLAADVATGVRGLPQRLGRRRSVLAAALLLLAGTGVVAVALPPDAWVRAATAAAALLLTAGAALGLRETGLGRQAPPGHEGSGGRWRGPGPGWEPEAPGAWRGSGRGQASARAPFTLTMLGAAALVVALVASGPTLA